MNLSGFLLTSDGKKARGFLLDSNLVISVGSIYRTPKSSKVMF
jgi:hypothetical protein